MTDSRVEALLRALLEDHMPVQDANGWECDGICGGRRFETWADWSAHIVACLSTLTGPLPEPASVDALAQDIRRVDGAHSLGAGALAQALFDLGWSRALSQGAPEQAHRPSHAAILRATVKLQELRAQGRDPEECMTGALREAYAQDFAGSPVLSRGPAPTPIKQDS